MHICIYLHICNSHISLYISLIIADFESPDFEATEARRARRDARAKARAADVVMMQRQRLIEAIHSSWLLRGTRANLVDD